ncbi:hypothetical protein ACHWQZ_G007446 [Mnemiopsis leidyi]
MPAEGFGLSSKYWETETLTTFSFLLSYIAQLAINSSISIMTETVKCQVKCKRCGEYTFEREVGNHEEGKKLALRLCRGEEKCQNEDCNKKLKVMDREAFKQEWDIVEQ